MKYSNGEIKKSIVDFIGDEGYEFFKKLKAERGRIWCVVSVSDEGFPYSTWTNEGRQIRNHVIDKFPGIVKELGDYGDFEEFIYTIVEEIFE